MASADTARPRYRRLWSVMSTSSLAMLVLVACTAPRAVPPRTTPQPPALVTTTTLVPPAHEQPSRSGRMPPTDRDLEPTTLAHLEQLVVEPERSRDGYDRGLFPHWIRQTDRCSTRERILIDQSLDPPQVDPFGCKVLEGRWFSLYDGYETDDPGELDIDHVVALAEAWDSGADVWDEDRRRAFANDLDTRGALFAVTAATNRSKGERDPADWQPSRRESWCTYVDAWVAVKATWSLSVDETELRALRNMYRDC